MWLIRWQLLTAGRQRSQTAATACIYFLNRLSKALRASDGFTEGAPLVAPPESRVSRSMELRAMKKSHRLRRSFLLMRLGICCVHSKRAAVWIGPQFFEERSAAFR